MTKPKEYKKGKRVSYLKEKQILFCCYHYKQFQYHCVMFYENSFVVPAYTPKLKGIYQSYLNKLQLKRFK